MYFSIKTIRGKLILAFSVFISLVVAVFLTTLWFDNQRLEIQHVVNQLSLIDRNIQKINKLEKDFFKDEAINPAFHESKKSKYLKERNALVEATIGMIAALKTVEEELSFTGLEALEQLAKDFQQYEAVFNNLVALVIERGYKDWGIEGKMREAIHQIEDGDAPFDKTMMLMCRRHEKDFILRKEQKYVDRLKGQASALRNNIQSLEISASQKEQMLGLLDNYEILFMEMVEAERKIGLDKQSGLRGKLSEAATDIEKKVAKISTSINAQAVVLRENIQLTSIIVMFVSVIFGIILSVYISSALGKPINQLSESIYNSIQSNFSKKVEIAKIETKDEVGRLSQDVSIMLGKVQDSIEVIEEKSKKLEEKQTLIMDSMRYAQQIQDTILPSSEDIHNFFSEHFTIYLPRDVVSGDFYWLNKKYEKTFLACVDCTGHGVPGAFMSMIGSTLLTKIVNEQKIFDPALILEVLHIEIQEELKQTSEKGEKNQDGMDMGIIMMEPSVESPTGRKITFAGAKQRLLYTRNKIFCSLEGTKRSIGGKVTAKQLERQFSSSVIELEQGDCLYMFTDGFPDQNNKEREKFGSRPLQNLIMENVDMPMDQQREVFLHALMEFKGEAEQRDDITFLGLKI